MTATIMTLGRGTASNSRPASYEKLVADRTELVSYCSMLLQQLDVVRSGHQIEVTRRYSDATIKAAQKELLDMHGYPTTFDEGGQRGFGVLTFL